MSPLTPPNLPGAGMALIPMRAELQITTKGADGKPVVTAVPDDAAVMWTLGSPSPPNTAGLFALVTRNPAPAANFTVPGAAPAAASFRLVGFKAGPASKDVKLLGDWGQPDPKAGELGPRAHVKQGAGPQRVTLYGVVTKAA